MTDEIIKNVEKMTRTGILKSQQFIYLCKKVNDLYVEHDADFFRRVTEDKNIVNVNEGDYINCSNNMKAIFDERVILERTHGELSDLLISIMRLEDNDEEYMVKKLDTIYELGDRQAIQKLKDIVEITEDEKVGFSERRFMYLLNDIQTEVNDLTASINVQLALGRANVNMDDDDD